MEHPIVNQLAEAMYDADGRPTTDANGRTTGIDRYRGWALGAIDGLHQLAGQAGVGTGLGVVLDRMARQAGDTTDLATDPEPADTLEARLQRAM